jgi:hypothetical protein
MLDEPHKAAGDSGQPDRPQDQGLTVAVNYLRWLEADGVLDPPTTDTTLEWLCRTIPHRPLVPSLIGRYAQLGNSDGMLFAFPLEQVLMEKVLIPLHQAKAAFIMGHELGCIALSGMVGEMLSIFRFQISPHGSGPHAMTETQQERFFGRTFERIDHGRRIGILELLRLIDSQTADQFLRLSRTRNAYLHRLSEPHEELAKNAKEAYGIVAGLAAKILGLGIETRVVKISPEVLDYVRNRAQDTPPEGTPPSGSSTPTEPPKP